MSEEIKLLNDYQHARLRTEMYLGSRSLHTQEILVYNESNEPVIKEVTWTPALLTSFREIFDNALDEISHGYGDCIDVTYDPDNLVISVEDNGRGIPIDFRDDVGMHTATMVISKTKSGRNFGERGTVAGTNGLGVSVVNYCSEKLLLEIIRDKKIFIQEFREDTDDLLVGTPKIKRTSKTNTGTKVTVTLSKSVFPSNATLPVELVKSVVWNAAAINPYTKFTFNGEKLKTRLDFDKTFFKSNNVINVKVNDDWGTSDFYVITDFVKEGEYHHSIVNNIPALQGGNHMDEFYRSFYSGVLNALGPQAKKRKLKLHRTDIADAILIANVTKMNAPNFDSQSKTRLINENIADSIKKTLSDESIFKKIVASNKVWAESILERCAKRTNKKEASEAAKLARRNLGAKLPKLRDANSKNRKDCILFLTEGDSAIAGFSDARNSDFHGGYPLRGKSLNVYGKKEKAVLENKEYADIMAATGLIIGEPVDRSKLRYGKVYIATDADEDGKNIAALLVQFFQKHWPELLDPADPFLHIFFTPLLGATKGKTRKYWYMDELDKFDPLTYNARNGWKVFRAKGLGRLEKPDWVYAIQNPKTFPIIEDGDIEGTIELIFGPDTNKRKEWMENDLADFDGPTSEYINKTSREFALYTVESRGIPRIGDGLKNVQRKALYAMMNEESSITTIAAVGKMYSKKIYVHGDASAANAISNLAAPYLNNVPWLTGEGQFGTVLNPHAFAAPRYTNVKKNDNLNNIMFKDKDIIPMQDNYDSSTKEPATFLPLIPTLLLNGASGIATGWATSILPRKINDILKATVNAIDGKSVPELEPGFEYADVVVEQRLGNLKWKIKGKFERIDATTIVIKSLPPGVTIESISEKLFALEDEKTINGFKDESTDGVSIIVNFKRGILNKLTDEEIIDLVGIYNNTAENIVAIGFDGKTVETYDNVSKLIKDFVAWRLQFFTQRYQRLLDIATNDLNYYNAIDKCFAANLPAHLHKIQSKDQLVQLITKLANCTDEVSGKIASSPTYFWIKDNHLKIIDKIKSLNTEIAEYNDLLNDPSKIKQVYKDEVKSIKIKVNRNDN